MKESHAERVANHSVLESFVYTSNCVCEVDLSGIGGLLQMIQRQVANVLGRFETRTSPPNGLKTRFQVTNEGD